MNYYRIFPLPSLVSDLRTTIVGIVFHCLREAPCNEGLGEVVQACMGT